MERKRSSWESTKVYDWKHYVIPARPSPSELKIYEEAIRKLKKRKKTLRVAILGSTVEFRSLCHKHRLDVTIIEFSQKHYEILSRQPIRHKGNETFVEEDWRTMSRHTPFDLVLGDLVLNVVPKKDIGKILKNVQKNLAPSGMCILRTWVRANDKRLLIERVIAQYRKSFARLPFYTAAIMPLYMCFYDFKRDCADYPSMISGLKTQLENKTISRSEYLSCYNRWKHEGSAFTIPLKSDIESLISKHFSALNVRFGTDAFKKWAPIYLLTRQ